MRLLLADDHSLFREALVQYIERVEPDSVIMLARDVHEVMEIMGGDPALDLILLDLRMPGMNGLQGLEKLKELYPSVPVALLSGLAEKQDVDQAMKLGAAGYFPKTLPGKMLIKGIKEIMSGGNYVARDHNTDEIMPSYYDGGYRDQQKSVYVGLGDQSQQALNGESPIRLTPRETEVLQYLRQGASNKEIARELDLQVVTVKLHVRGICRKLGAKNRTQAALIANQQGL